MPNPKVIYLTGAPAAGKSTTLNAIAEARPEVLRFEYGAELTQHIKSKRAISASQEDLREKSAEIVGPEDIKELDDRLLQIVTESRAERIIIIDSHPVTKERYGFRITAFDSEQLLKLRPDEIWVFFTGPRITVERITNDPGGRPPIDEEMARLHTFLQSSVAATYSVISGAPTYLFDTNTDQSALVEALLTRIDK